MFNLNFRAMKKVVKFLSFAFLGCFLVVASAVANVEKSKKDAKASENYLREQLANTLSKVTFDDDSEVSVYFTVSAKDGVQITRVASPSPELTSRVKETLKAQHIEAPSNMDGKYLIKVSFIKG
jgi:DNA/RNA-binding domain of Phe-tRNA-synthetase-like protein